MLPLADSALSPCVPPLLSPKALQQHDTLWHHRFVTLQLFGTVFRSLWSEILPEMLGMTFKIRCLPERI